MENVSAQEEIGRKTIQLFYKCSQGCITLAASGNKNFQEYLANSMKNNTNVKDLGNEYHLCTYFLL